MAVHVSPFGLFLQQLSRVPNLFVVYRSLVHWNESPLNSPHVYGTHESTTKHFSIGGGQPPMIYGWIGGIGWIGWIWFGCM